MLHNIYINTHNNMYVFLHPFIYTYNTIQYNDYRCSPSQRTPRSARPRQVRYYVSRQGGGRHALGDMGMSLPAQTGQRYDLLEPDRCAFLSARLDLINYQITPLTPVYSYAPSTHKPSNLYIIYKPSIRIKSMLDGSLRWMLASSLKSSSTRFLHVHLPLSQ